MSVSATHRTALTFFLTPDPKLPNKDVRLFLSRRPIYCFFVSLLCSHDDDSLVFYECFRVGDSPSRVEFLLKTDSGYPRDAEVTSFSMSVSVTRLRFL